MDKKMDYKKEYKDIYMPKTQPMLITLPPISYIMVNGKGAPEGLEYKDAMQILYSLSFSIKMSKMTNDIPQGYFEYVVPPLEGLWYGESGMLDLSKRDSWNWISMIRQPEFVTKEIFENAVSKCMQKNKNINFDKARFETFDEGLCVQIMHIGPYSEEKRSTDLIDKYINDNNLLYDFSDTRKHHEIYLGDPRKTDPNKLKTVIRIPVKKKIVQ